MVKSYLCVIDVRILCVSCIYTFPAQSEISVLFKENETTKEVVLDILMYDILKSGICQIRDYDGINIMKPLQGKQYLTN